MTIKETHFKLPGQSSFYRGKVRDVYTVKTQISKKDLELEKGKETHDKDVLIMVVSDRISAFDHVLPEAIPFKGQVLNEIAAWFLEQSKNIVPNWVIAIPDPNVTIGLVCKTYPVEMVIRGYLAGHAWRVYKSGGRLLCGIVLPEGLHENDRLPHPIITPSTKAMEGHDEDISREEIISQGIVSEKEYLQLEAKTRMLFDFGQQKAFEQGLILVDTKYEFGIYNNEIYLIDEIHTPDSSRYFYLDTYKERQDARLPQRQLSKEFVREWLIENGFQGLEGQIMPVMSDEKIQEISLRYIELFEKITGKSFKPRAETNLIEAVEKNIFSFLKNYA